MSTLRTSEQIKSISVKWEKNAHSGPEIQTCEFVTNLMKTLRVNLDGEQNYTLLDYVSFCI